MEGPAGDVARLLHPQTQDLTILKLRHSAFVASPLELLLAEMQARAGDLRAGYGQVRAAHRDGRIPARIQGLVTGRLHGRRVDPGQSRQPGLHVLEPEVRHPSVGGGAPEKQQENAGLSPNARHNRPVAFFGERSLESHPSR